MADGPLVQHKAARHTVVTLEWTRDLRPSRSANAVALLTSHAEAFASPRPAPNMTDLADAERRPRHERADFVLRRTMLRRFAADHLGVDPAGMAILARPFGAPQVAAPLDRFHVSAAHRNGWLALAIASSPIGIDLETTEPEAEPAWAMLAAEERARLHAEPESERPSAFLRYWTAKEAYLKATAEGLSRDPAEVAVTLVDAERFELTDRGLPARLSTAEHRSFDIDGRSLVAACVVLVDGSSPSG